MQRLGVIFAVIAVLFIFSGVACGDGCGGGSHVYIHGGRPVHRRGWFGGWGHRRGYAHRGFGFRGGYTGFRGGSSGFRGGGRSFGK